MQLAKYKDSKGKASRGMGEFRSMSLDEVKRLQYGQHIWFVSTSGDARECKVNGAPRTWKRDTARVELPIKYGLYEYATFDSRDVANGRLLVEVETGNPPLSAQNDPIDGFPLAEDEV